MPAGTSGFQRLNMSDGSAARNSPQPPIVCRPKKVRVAEPRTRIAGLHRLGVGDRAHAAEDGVEAGQEHHRQGADPEAVELPAEQVHPPLGDERAEHDAAREDAHRDLGQDVGHQGDDGEHPARGRREAPLEELGHRVHARPHVEGHHHPAEDEQAPGVQLVVGHRDTARGARARQAHEVLGPDVRGEDGRPDDPPPQVSPGEEVVVGGVLALEDHPPGQREQAHEVPEDDQPVDGVECRHALSLIRA